MPISIVSNAWFSDGVSSLHFCHLVTAFSGFSGFFRSLHKNSIYKEADILFNVLQNEPKKPEKPEKPVVGAASSDEHLKEAWMRLP
jgi:hypothetical protein